MKWRCTKSLRHPQLASKLLEYISMERLFQPLLFFLARCSRNQLIRQIEGTPHAPPPGVEPPDLTANRRSRLAAKPLQPPAAAPARPAAAPARHPAAAQEEARHHAGQAQHPAALITARTSRERSAVATPTSWRRNAARGRPLSPAAWAVSASRLCSHVEPRYGRRVSSARMRAVR